MTRQASLSITRLERRLSTGNTEELVFGKGVNVLVGRPNTGKTKWLQTLDYLLGGSCQTWPELRFRMLLRHIYRQQ